MPVLPPEYFAKQKPTAPVKTSEEAPAVGHKLTVGDVFLRGGKEFVVWFKNDSRASICLLSNSTLASRVMEDDGKIRFHADGKDVESISPNSEVKIERSLHREGLAEYLSKRNSTETKEENMPKTSSTSVAPKSTKTSKKVTKTSTPGIRAGSLGTFDHPQLKDYSIAAVIRAMAKNGWTFAECKAYCDKQGVKASDQTIKLNIYRGKNNKDGEPAPVKADLLKELKPKVAQKESKSAPAPEKSSKKKEGKKGKAKASTSKPSSGKDGKDGGEVTTSKKASAGDKAAAQIKALKEAKKAA